MANPYVQPPHQYQQQQQPPEQPQRRPYYQPQYNQGYPWWYYIGVVLLASCVMNLVYSFRTTADVNKQLLNIMKENKGNIQPVELYQGGAAGPPGVTDPLIRATDLQELKDRVDKIEEYMDKQEHKYDRPDGCPIPV